MSDMLRVVRGGSWFSQKWLFRSCHRACGIADILTGFLGGECVGFRIVVARKKR